MTMRAGHVVVGGRPNVGKSTLFNALLGPRLSIVSRRRQTTRYSIRGVLTEADTQMVFVDTPGWQRRDKGALNRALTDAAEQAVPFADAGILVMAGERPAPDDERVAGLFPAQVPVVAVLNKADLVKRRERMLPVAEQVSKWREFSAIIPASARTGENVGAIRDEVRRLMPEAAALYPPGTLSDRGDAFFLADFIRERIFCLLGEELPYRAAVEVRSIERQPRKRCVVHADIIVDTESRKAMFIGSGGRMLKRIGSTARPLIESFLDARVHLQLFVRVQRDWTTTPAQLARLGLGT